MTARQKRPWQMTKAEWFSFYTYHKLGYEGTSKGRRSNKSKKLRAAKKHRWHVVQAIRTGRHVPTEVLADYPELIASAR